MIEDDADYAYMLRLHLAEAGGPNARYVIHSAGTLAEGRELLSSAGFDVVLLDLMLPDSRGLDGLAALRRQAPELPVVVMTNLNDEETGLQAIAQGAQDFLIKEKVNAIALKRTIGYARERSRLLNQFEAIIDRSTEGMLVVDRAGHILYANAAALTFFDQRMDEMLGRTFDFPLLPGTHREISWKASGGERVGQLRVAELEWRMDKAFLASIHDITELRKLEQLKAEIKERRRIDKLKDEFISSVSHELRSPLTVIKAVVVNLWDGLAGPMTEPQNQLIYMALRNVERLARIVNNVLDISRLESGRAKLRPRPLDLRQVVLEAVEGARLVEAKGRVSIGFTLPPQDCPIWADPDMIAQVLNNLLDNAIRHAKSSISVIISSHAQDQAQVAVIDDGPGIPVERLPELFDRFLQVNRPVGGAGYKGTGLGLAICREIIRLNGGRIWAESSPGSGARFIFTVPRFRGDGGQQECRVDAGSENEKARPDH